MRDTRLRPYGKMTAEQLKQRLAPYVKMDGKQLVDAYCSDAELRALLGEEIGDFGQLVTFIIQYCPDSLITQDEAELRKCRDIPDTTIEAIIAAKIEVKKRSETNHPVWTGPLGIKKWAEAFKVSQSTMRRWFKEEKYKNKQVSARKWSILYKDLPAEIVARVEKQAE